MPRSVYPLLGAVAYLIFFATFLYLVAFVGDLPLVSITVDRGGSIGMPALAPVIDLLLIALFGLQHSVMARHGFKQAWIRIVPPPLERSVYVLAASGMLIVMMALWQPLTAPIWRVDHAIGAGVLWTLFAAGWAIVLLSTFLLNHFELFGLQQVWLHARGLRAMPPTFRTPFFYRLVRHPLYSGFILAFWATPKMTLGHLLLAAGMTVYILIAIRYEERDLAELFGARYDQYRREVGMLTPRLRGR